MTPLPPTQRPPPRKPGLAQVGIVHYQLMILTILAEAPPLGRLPSQAGLLEWGSVTGVVLTMAESVRLRHAAAVALYVVGCWRQHEAIVHLASLRGGGSGGGKVRARVCACFPRGGFMPLWRAL